MKRTLGVALAGLLALSGCQPMDSIDLEALSPRERDAVSHLTWLQDADATRDAQRAIRRGDRRLLAMATRGPDLPGVPADQVSRAKSVCGIRYVEGSTDAVMGQTHLKLLQAARDYASQYNRIMLDTCLGK